MKILLENLENKSVDFFVGNKNKKSVCSVVDCGWESCELVNFVENESFDGGAFKHILLLGCCKRSRI